MGKQMTKVGILGASGYGGGELLRYLAGHPCARVHTATSKTYDGQPVAAAFGGLISSSLKFRAEEFASDLDECDIVFLAGGDSSSMCLAEPLLDSGKKVIDLGACFRFDEAAEYEHWYHEPHKSPHLNATAVYGLPELHRDEIKLATLIANPGCYTTAAILALAPAVQRELIDCSTLIINGISGVSGAGRSKFGLDYHFAEMNENAWAYKVGGSHRHTGEIEQELSKLAGGKVTLSFTPHVVPMTRGVLVTCIAELNDRATFEAVKAAYSEAYATEPFVHLVGKAPATKHTIGSNQCHIHLAFDERTQRITVVSVLDNLGKGMAGQAIQNMNLMFGLEETAGLEGVPLWP